MMFVFGHEGYLWAVEATITEKPSHCGACGMALDSEPLEVFLEQVVRENTQVLINNLSLTVRNGLKDKVRAAFLKRRP